MKVLKPHAHGPVAVFKAGGDEPVLHLGHFRAHGYHQAVSGTGGEHRVPGAPDALVNGAGAENIGGASGGYDDCPGLEDVQLVLADAETDGAGNAVGVVGVGKQVGDGHPLVDVLLAHGLAGGFGGNWLDRLAVNGNLPATDALVGAVVLLPDG